MRILLAQQRTSDHKPLLMALARQCCPVHLTIVDRGDDLLRAATRKHYDCVIVEAPLLDGRTGQSLESAEAYRLDCAVLVVLGTDLGDISFHTLHGRTTHLIDPTDDVDWHAWVNRLLASIRFTDPSTGQRSVDGDRHSAEPGQSLLTAPNFHRRLERNLLDLSTDRHRDNHHACILIGIDPVQTVGDQSGSKTIADTDIQSVTDLLTRHVGEPSTVVHSTKNDFLVIRPGCTLVDAWIWSERIRRSIEQSGIGANQDRIGTTISIGVAEVSTRTMCPTMIDQADQALRMAQQQGHNRICTWDMVAIERILKCSTISRESGLNRRRDAFLAKCKPNLGPTQFEHLTCHAQRVAQVAVRIGQKMAMSIQEIGCIRIAALLHDIGKCLIPEQILAKPAALSIEEFQLMSLHAPLGARLASQLGANDLISAMIYHHHTRYDRHRATDSHRLQAPLGARVLCVADAFVTMTSDRTYRPAHEVAEAMHELRRQRGSQFDPDVVDVVHCIGLPCLGQAAA